MLLIQAWGESTAGPAAVLLAMASFVGCASVLFFWDAKERRLPNVWTLALFASGVVSMSLMSLSGLTPPTSGAFQGWQGMIFGSLGYCALMLVLHVGTRGGFGMGDVKLAAGLGVYAGWFGVGSVVASFILGLVIGGVVAVALTMMRRATLQSRVAFGPGMLIGAAIPVLFAGWL